MSYIDVIYNDAINSVNEKIKLLCNELGYKDIDEFNYNPNFKTKKDEELLFAIKCKNSLIESRNSPIDDYGSGYDNNYKQIKRAKSAENTLEMLNRKKINFHKTATTNVVKIIGRRNIYLSLVRTDMRLKYRIEGENKWKSAGLNDIIKNELT